MRPDELEEQAQDFNTLLLTDEEEADLYNRPLLNTAKSAAGIAAYAIPGGSTIGGAKGIGQAALRGAGSGALSGFGLSEEGQELSGTLQGGALGGLLGGALQGVSEASQAIKLNKTAKKLADTADDFEVNAYTKKIGSKPTMKQGKYDLARESLGLQKAQGASVNSADDLYAFSDDLFKKYGGVSNQYARQLDDMGVGVSVSEIKKPLLKELAKTQTPELKEPLQRVISSIDEATGGADIISVSDAMNLRREWGNLGNWNQFTPASEKAVASAWEKVYNNSNNVLDDLFKQSGVSDFREVNKILKTAIDQQNWARRAKAMTSGQQVWTDIAQDATMFGTAVGGGPGALAGFLGSTGLQRYGEQAAATGLRTGSKVLGGGGSQVVPQLAQVGQRAIPALPGMLGQGQPEQGTEQMGMQPDIYGDMGQPQLDQSALINAVLSGQISTSEADWLMEMLGGGAGQQALPKTDSGRKAMVARDAAINALGILEQDPKAAGKLQGVENIFYDVTGQANTATQYNTQLETLRSQLFNALGGTSLTPTEKKQYEKFLPKITDSTAQAQQKLQGLIPMLESLMGTEVDTQLDEGNTSALTQLLGLQ
jgi:hypothetical protein